MKISLSEIWNFSELIDVDEKGWSYSLQAGDVLVEGITQQTLLALKKDANYDTELLPSIFTFREIAWQPDVFTEASQSLPGLRILHSFCMETVEEYQQRTDAASLVYAQLLQGLAGCCDLAVKSLEAENAIVNRVLGDFRTRAFPIFKFFIFHPQNRVDYYKDAVNRLNYAVKIMLTQFHGRYTALQDPYWEVQYKQTEPAEPKAPKRKEVAKEPSND